MPSSLVKRLLMESLAVDLTIAAQRHWAAHNPHCMMMSASLFP
jgi:hypothetical protein